MEPFLNGDAKALTLRPKASWRGALDGSKIQPSVFATMSRAEIESTLLKSDSGPMRLGDLFDVSGDPSQRIVIDGDCSQIVDLGWRMESGSMLVRGNAGTALAGQMRGGHIEILGDCGDYLATSMFDGTVVVHGSAGDCVAGPSPGERRGMRGGDCIVLGGVGSRAAERMRRGMLFVGGDAGDFGASQMIAGTIVVMGAIGPDWAAGMRRGSIILSTSTRQAFAAELTPPREFELSFLPLIWRHLQTLLGQNRVKLPSSRWAARQLGDRANQGQGEVLSLTRHSHR